MPDPLPLFPLPTLRGERVILRRSRDCDVDDRLAHPIDPEEEDNYGSQWRREWDGRRYHTREHLSSGMPPPDPVTTGIYSKIRNPIYTFGSCVLAGLILALGRPVWLLVFILVIPLQIWRAQVEARVLEAKFGEQYRNYRVGTWF